MGAAVHSKEVGAVVKAAKPKRLTALFIKSNRLATGMYSDGGGLYLSVRESGSRSWMFRYRERGTGKQRDLGLGSAGLGGVSLDDARERAGELKAGCAVAQTRWHKRGRIAEPVMTPSGRSPMLSLMRSRAASKTRRARPIGNETLKCGARRSGRSGAKTSPRRTY
jgi:hypothetical protein